MNTNQGFCSEWKEMIREASYRSKTGNRYSNNDNAPKRRKRKSNSTCQSPAVKTRSKKRKEVCSGRRKCSWTCMFPGCNNNNHTEGKTFHACPTKPKPPKTYKFHYIRNYHLKKKLYYIVMDRLDNKAKDMKTPRWCSDHLSSKKDTITFEYRGKRYTETHEFQPVPMNAGPKLAPQTISKGTAIDRHNTSFLRNLSEADHLLIRVMDNQYSPGTLYSESAEAILPKPQNIDNSKILSTTTSESNPNSNKEPNESHIPTVKPGTKDSEVKRRTGFISEHCMLQYIVIVCNGDLKKMKQTTTTMTWYEEWFAYFERTWGHSVRREEDLQAAFNIDRRRLRSIFDAKLEMELTFRRSWPCYCSYDEDIKLCSNKWDGRYESLRIFFWDDSNVPFQYKPALAHVQRLTYSLYYSMCCGKMAIFIQRNGWLGTSEAVFTGGISDSSMMVSVDQDPIENMNHKDDEPHSVLGRQLHFQRNDLVDGEVKPAHNILDKGYKITQEAVRLDQHIIQPNFMNAKKGFKGEDVLCTAEVASDRSGNERAVKIVKRSAYITDGIAANQLFARMEKVVKAFSCRCNFMFRPIH